MEKTDDADGRAMYAYLVEQEEGHHTILQGEYDYLTGTGFWFDFQEFDLEAAG
jgi:rubrerythrin